MKRTHSLTWRGALTLASMLFGLFFGAGNIIFPIQMGQEAASHWLPASLGLILTAVGLPLLAVLALGQAQSPHLFLLARRVNRPYGYFLVTLLYLTIGPLVAIPRLATVSFAVGFSSLQPSPGQLLAYSAVFFACAYGLARRPQGLLERIGGLLNPIFLGLLGLILVVVFSRTPWPTATQLQPAGAFQASGFLPGLLAGYQTLDAPAGLAFGVLVIRALHQLHIKEPRQVALGTLKSGVLTVSLMAILYLALTLLGFLSLGQLPRGENGGAILAALVLKYFGGWGVFLVFLVMFLTCLKTAVGLLAAGAETLAELYPRRLNFRQWLVLLSLLSFAFANLGLESLLKWTMPLLLFIYPLCIVLILLSLWPNIQKWRRLEGWVTALTLVAAAFDLLKALPIDLLPQTISVLESSLPGFSQGFGWLLPAGLGLSIGLGHEFLHRRLEKS